MPEAPAGETLVVSGRRIHYALVGSGFSGTPIVFLHEGLGSVELWREFPRKVVTASRHPGVVYSRHGNGWSEPLDGPRDVDYMHFEAREVLPDVVARLTETPPILVGHSDGASIALIHAGSGHPVAGLALIAPHVFVEPLTLESIGALRRGFAGSDMSEKMAKYHTDPQGTFLGWADVWLNPKFRSWNIEEYLTDVSCPTLVVQGDADEYGTLRQLDAIDAGLPQPAQRLVVEGAGHSPHLSHMEIVTRAVVDLIQDLG